MGLANGKTPLESMQSGHLFVGGMMMRSGCAVWAESGGAVCEGFGCVAEGDRDGVAAVRYCYG